MSAAFQTGHPAVRDRVYTAPAKTGQLARAGVTTGLHMSGCPWTCTDRETISTSKLTQMAALTTYARNEQDRSKGIHYRTLTG